MHGAEVGMTEAVEPYGSGCQTGDCRQQKDPPEHSSDGVAVLGEPREPVAVSVMQVDVAERQNCQQYSEYYMHPYRPCVLTGGGFKLYPGCQHQNQDAAERAIAEFES